MLIALPEGVSYMELRTSFHGLYVRSVPRLLAEEPHLKDEIREAGGIEVLVKLLASKVSLRIVAGIFSMRGSDQWHT